MFKNARSCATDQGYLVEGIAPSYFVDCLIYNVPDYCFVDDLAETYCNVVNYLNKAALSGFVCRNEIVSLFGPSSEQWSENAARQLIGSLIRLWNESVGDKTARLHYRLEGTARCSSLARRGGGRTVRGYFGRFGLT